MKLLLFNPDNGITGNFMPHLWMFLPMHRERRASAGFMVVMGGPHVTELPDESLGRNGGPGHIDAVALGEADEAR
jgi:radical SAM superfamily enzyme YgiQ (UPF0313 family)